MAITEQEAKTGEGYALTGEEGLMDFWWPYVEGPSIGKYRTKVTGEQSDGRLFQMHATHYCGDAPPLHIHHDADETFYVLDGEMTIFVGDERIECKAGDFVFGPRGVPHAFLVQSERAEFLVTFTPAGMEGFFAAVAPPVVPGEPAPAPTMPDQEEFIRQMAAYQCEFLAPPPTLD